MALRGCRREVLASVVFTIGFVKSTAVNRWQKEETKDEEGRVGALTSYLTWRSTARAPTRFVLPALAPMSSLDELLVLHGCTAALNLCQSGYQTIRRLFV